MLRGGRRGKLDVVDAKVVESLGNLDLGLGIEEGVCELLALTEGRLDCWKGNNISGVFSMYRQRLLGEARTPCWEGCDSLILNLETLLKKSPTGW